MEHLHQCAHAIVRTEDNVVVNVVNSVHESELLDALNAVHPDETYVVCCCDHGMGGIDQIWHPNKKKWQPYQPFSSWSWNEETWKWESPVGNPPNDTWTWNEEQLEWVQRL